VVAVLASQGEVQIEATGSLAFEGAGPELADMTVLADPNGPLDNTVAAKRPISLRDLLTYTLGTGMVPAEPGTVPIADALNALGKPPPDEWMGRLGTLPLVHQPGERRQGRWR
jgi:hypothetical protein